MAANWQYSYAVTGESYGTTTSSTGPYTHTANESPTAPVLPNSVVIKEAGVTIATDNGSGVLSGSGITGGTINYTTGAMSFSFTSAPSSGQALTVNYSAQTYNCTPAILDGHLYLLKQILKQAGWVVEQSGTGSGGTFASSDLITSGSTSTVGGIGNASCWFRIRAPGGGSGTRELLFQRSSSTAGNWYIGVSNLGFTGNANGTVSATVAPTATDQHGLWGATSAGASNTVTTAAYVGSYTAGTYHVELAADANSPYGVYMGSFLKNSSTTNNAGFMFVVDSLAANSYNASDPDPFVYLCASGTSYAFSPTSFSGGGATSGVGVASINNVLSNNCQWLTGLPTTFIGNPYTGYDDLLPLWYYFNASANSNTYKGQSYYFSWESNARVTPTLITQNSTNDTLILGAWCLPWNGGSITLG